MSVKPKFHVQCFQTFAKLDKKNIVIPAIQDFQWSPVDNYIAYWTPGDKRVPCRVSMMKIPSKDELASRNMFNVDSVRNFLSIWLIFPSLCLPLYVSSHSFTLKNNVIDYHFF